MKKDYDNKAQYVKKSASIICAMFALIAVIYVGLFGWGCQDSSTQLSDPFANPYHKKEVTVDLGGGVQLVMIYIEGGSFQMGQSDSEKEWLIKKVGLASNNPVFSRESPQRTVTLDGFWIGKYEVTQAQYRAIMGTNPSYFFFKGANRPVEQVSWYDAMVFCRKLSERTRRIFTLPTEAQWEYACRAGTTGPFAFGNCLSTSDVNYNGEIPLSGCSKGVYRQSTWDVGSGRANAWGLYDMHGNVWEWCLDWYGPYTSSTKRNPVGPDFGRNRVYRGGSWSNYDLYCRSAFRFRLPPSFMLDDLGFRLVSPDLS